MISIHIFCKRCQTKLLSTAIAFMSDGETCIEVMPCPKCRRPTPAAPEEAAQQKSAGWSHKQSDIDEQTKAMFDQIEKDDMKNAE